MTRDVEVNRKAFIAQSNMNYNMLKILTGIYLDKGYIVNELIMNKVLTKKDVVNAAAKSYSYLMIMRVVMYVERLERRDIEKLASVIIDRGIATECLPFAIQISSKNIDDVYIEQLADVVMLDKDAEFIYRFAKCVKNAPIERLATAIKMTNNKYWIKRFEDDIELMRIREIPDNEKNKSTGELQLLNDDEKLSYLYTLIRENKYEEIKINADIYRNLFINNKIKSNSKKRTLKK